MNDSVTILGRVGNDPIRTETAGGTTVTNFRLASTQRRFDAKTQTWTDVNTNWYSVAAFRQLGENVKASLHSGDAVIVTGRLKVREWENSNGKKGTSVDIEAESVGHDLRWGASAFARSSRPSPSANSGLVREDQIPSPEPDPGFDSYAEEEDEAAGELAAAGRGWSPAES